MLTESGRLVPVCSASDANSRATDANTVTITVCVSHGDINSYPYSHTLSVPDTNTGIAFADAIRDAVLAQQEKGVRSRS